jgi:two-component system response regulator FixJ
MSPHSTPAVAAPTIVVIDDDAAVRNSLKFSLEIEGFTVCTYASPIDVLNGDGLPAVACLIVDQNMPGMSGLNLLAALRRRGDRTPAILVSDEAADRGVAVVEKPFVGNALVDRIRAVITNHTG